MQYIEQCRNFRILVVPSITVVRLIVKFPLTNQNRQKVVEEK